MSLYNLQYRKIVKGYFDISNYGNFEVNFVKKSKDWFFIKKDRHITFNTNFYEIIKPFVDKEPIHFISCLMTCCVCHMQKVNKKEMTASHLVAIRTLDAPFKDEKLKLFLKSKIGYTLKENYRHLEIADEIENRFFSFP